MPFLPVIDDSSCLAHGDCAQVAPHVFAVDDTAVIIGAGELAELRAAADACPAGAIAIIDTDSGLPVSP